jgi:hypothetical protein
LIISLLRFSTKFDLKIALIVGKFLLYLYFNVAFSVSISNLSVLINKSLLHIIPIVLSIDINRSPYLFSTIFLFSSNAIISEKTLIKWYNLGTSSISSDIFCFINGLLLNKSKNIRNMGLYLSSFYSRMRSYSMSKMLTI